MNGTLRKGEKVRFINTGRVYQADELGILQMDLVPKNEVSSGNVGYIITGIKISKEIGYNNAGTVEFLLDADRGHTRIRRCKTDGICRNFSN